MLLLFKSLAILASLLSTQCYAVGAVYVPQNKLQKRAVAYYSPAAGGGSMLDNVGGGLGEPLNVIISGLSSPTVLTDDGFLNFMQSVNFSGECLGIHSGTPQSANLGDGNGWVNQTIEIRQDYGNTELGTCLETLIGGNHLRMFRQNGTTANSEALFLAVSKEKSLSDHHTIDTDGYNVGRDELVSSATSGETSHNGVSYSTTEQDITGLLTAGTAGINHDIAIDRVVKLLTITIV